jgi:hypothetical protein
MTPNFFMLPRSERRASRSIAGTVPTARAERATTMQAQTASPARSLTPERLPVSSMMAALALPRLLETSSTAPRTKAVYEQSGENSNGNK